MKHPFPKLNVIVTRRLPWPDLRSVARDLARKKMTFGLREIPAFKDFENRFEIWRAQLPDESSRKDRATYGKGVIAVRDENCPDNKEFIAVWIFGKKRSFEEENHANGEGKI